MEHASIDLRFKDFMKKAMLLSDKFIEDYCYFKEESLKTTFGIDMKEVIKRLEISNSKKFYYNFTKKYTENINYVVEIQTKRGSNQARRKYYKTNFNTLRKICMSVKNKRGRSLEITLLLSMIF